MAETFFWSGAICVFVVGAWAFAGDGYTKHSPGFMKYMQQVAEQTRKEQLDAQRARKGLGGEATWHTNARNDVTDVQR